MQFSFGSERSRPHYVKAFGAEGAGENFETNKKSGGLHEKKNNLGIYTEKKSGIYTLGVYSLGLTKKKSGSLH